MMDVIQDREVWRFNLELLLRNPHGKASNKERKTVFGLSFLRDFAEGGSFKSKVLGEGKATSC